MSYSYGATHTVTFGDFSFTPSSLTVDVGDTVVFQHQSGTHTVTGTGNDPFCGTGAVADSCSVTFNTPGTYPYRCIFHSSDGPNPAGMTGTVTVAAASAEKPNLVPFRLNGWTSPLVVSRKPGNNISDPDFSDDQDIYVDWAIANVSLTAAIPQRFFTEVRIDGVSKSSWFHDGLAPDTYNKIEDANMGKLPAGEHVFSLVTDHTLVVDESNENDNVYEVNVRVLPTVVDTHIVLVSNYEFSPPSLTVKKGDTVEFHNIEGTHTVTGTAADPFCGSSSLGSVCSVKFNTTGTFPYRCLFHSTDGPNSQGMIGQVRVIDAVVPESAATVLGPFQSVTNARISYPEQTVTIPIPSTPTFWRLNSTSALRISQVSTTDTSIIIQFQ
jgi:plastocyanin